MILIAFFISMILFVACLNYLMESVQGQDSFKNEWRNCDSNKFLLHLLPFMVGPCPVFFSILLATIQIATVPLSCLTYTLSSVWRLVSSDSILSHPIYVLTPFCIESNFCVVWYMFHFFSFGLANMLSFLLRNLTRVLYLFISFVVF